MEMLQLYLFIDDNVPSYSETTIDIRFYVNVNYTFFSKSLER
jgi:hypothetical protein